MACTSPWGCRNPPPRQRRSLYSLRSPNSSAATKAEACGRARSVNSCKPIRRRGLARFALATQGARACPHPQPTISARAPSGVAVRALLVQASSIGFLREQRSRNPIISAREGQRTTGRRPGRTPCMPRSWLTEAPTGTYSQSTSVGCRPPFAPRDSSLRTVARSPIPPCPVPAPQPRQPWSFAEGSGSRA